MLFTLLIPDTNLNENELANSVIEPKDKPHSTATEPNDQRENIQNRKEVTEEDQYSTEYLKQSQEAKRAVHGMKGWPYFKRVFMVSALSGDGLGDIKVLLVSNFIVRMKVYVFINTCMHTLCGGNILRIWAERTEFLSPLGFLLLTISPRLFIITFLSKFYLNFF